MSKVSIRAGAGLGDSLYMQSIVRWMIAVRGEPQVEVCTSWSDVFAPLRNQYPGKVSISPFRRSGVTHISHYVDGKVHPGTTQFQDCCLRAGVPSDIALHLDWELTRTDTVQRLHDAAGGKPIIVVQLPRPPMDRKDGYGIELMPRFDVMQRVIDLLHGRAFIVQIGAGQCLYEFQGLDVNLAGATTVAEMIDVVAASQGCLGYVSFLVPLAESLGKPLMTVWSRKGLNSQTPYIRRITPAKALHYANSTWVVDDADEEVVDTGVDAFYRHVRPQPVRSDLPMSLITGAL